MKKLILVGNKPPVKRSLAKKIDSFDYVIRVNRMNYLGPAGLKIDGLFFEPSWQWNVAYQGGPHRDKVKTASQIFMREKYYDSFDEASFEYITRKQYEHIELVNESFAIEATKFERLTSSIKLLGHLLNSDWKERYTIYITCLDIESRAYLIDHDPIWRNHQGAGYPEQEYLKQQLKLKNIHHLAED